MVAYRVIDDHRELENIGTLSHDQIDGYITGSSWLLTSGSTQNRPAGSRVLTSGTGIKLLDNGPGGSFLVSTNVVAGSGITVSTGSNGELVISSRQENAIGFLPAKWNERPFGTIDGLNTIYTLTYTPAPREGLMLFHNGVLMDEGEDFTLSENVITFNYPPSENTKLKAMYPIYDVLDVTWNDKPAGEANGTNYTFLLNHTPVAPADMMLFVNGVLQDQGEDNDYVISGRVITFLHTAPPMSSKVKAIYQAQSGSENNALIDALASIAAGNSYRKGSLSGSSVVGGVIDISSIGKFRPGYDHQRDVDLYLNGMLLRGAIEGADYFIVNETKIFLEIPTKNDDIITVIIRNSAI